MSKVLAPLPLMISFSILVMVVAAIFLIWPNEITTTRLAQVTLPDGQLVVADIADDPATRAKGLSGRLSIEPDRGMLFLFDRRTLPTFWMPNMKFPIDIIWIDGATVVSITENVQPEGGVPTMRYSPTEPVNTVLEVNAGYAAAHGLKAGDTLDIQIPAE